MSSKQSSAFDDADDDTGSDLANSRVDTQMANLVEEAIVIAEREGRQAATDFLVKNNIPLSVALRVLLRPELRRK